MSSGPGRVSTCFKLFWSFSISWTSLIQSDFQTHLFALSSNKYGTWNRFSNLCCCVHLKFCLPPFSLALPLAVWRPHSFPMALVKAQHVCVCDVWQSCSWTRRRRKAVQSPFKNLLTSKLRQVSLSKPFSTSGYLCICDHMSESWTTSFVHGSGQLCCDVLEETWRNQCFDEVLPRYHLFPVPCQDLSGPLLDLLDPSSLPSQAYEQLTMRPFILGCEMCIFQNSSLLKLEDLQHGLQLSRATWHGPAMVE